jgi:hypothetical protein
MKQDYIRTPQDLALEYAAVLKTVASRKPRLPASEAGMAHAKMLDEVAASIAVCVLPGAPPTLVNTADALATCEEALIAARARLAETVDEFIDMDTAQRIEKSAPAPQVVGVLPSGQAAVAVSPDAKQ